jgi:membrane protease YdiL (CAAX protease family)
MIQLRETGPRGRALPIWGYLAVVAGYVVLVQVLGVVLTSGIDAEYASPTTVDALWRGISVPVGAGLVYVAVAVTVLRWWRPVALDARPVRGWVVVVPVAMLGSIVLSTNYAGLADRGFAFSLLLLASALCVGFAEETLFRGIGVTAFRARGFPEARVALWSSVVFGLAHASNLISTGPKAFAQVLVTAIAGYFFYLIRRRTGGLLAAAIVHGLWDFALISSTVVPGKTYFGLGVGLFAIVALTIIVYALRRDIEPPPPRPPGPAGDHAERTPR